MDIDEKINLHWKEIVKICKEKLSLEEFDKLDGHVSNIESLARTKGYLEKNN